MQIGKNPSSDIAIKKSQMLTAVNNMVFKFCNIMLRMVYGNTIIIQFRQVSIHSAGCVVVKILNYSIYNMCKSVLKRGTDVNKNFSHKLTRTRTKTRKRKRTCVTRTRTRTGT